MNIARNPLLSLRLAEKNRTKEIARTAKLPESPPMTMFSELRRFSHTV